MLSIVSSYTGILENPFSIISSQTSSNVSSPSRANIDVLGVITSLAVVSPKPTIECIISFSSSSMIPSASPTFTKEIISSSVIISPSSCSSIPINLPINFDIIINIFIIGFRTQAK